MKLFTDLIFLSILPTPAVTITAFSFAFELVGREILFENPEKRITGE